MKFTKIVSSPTTSMSFQWITISGSLPSAPNRRLRPQMTMDTICAVQVSTSTSSTYPKRVPSQMLMTSFSCMSVMRAIIINAPFPAVYEKRDVDSTQVLIRIVSSTNHKKRDSQMAVPFYSNYFSKILEFFISHNV